MKRLGAVVAATFLFVASAAFAADKPAEKAKPAAKAGGGAKAVIVPVEEMKWVDPPNSPPGVKMAVAWGNPEKGPHGAFHKLPAGFDAPLHFHTANHKVVVVSGTLILTPEGGTEKKLGPGSYFSFSGKKKHTTKCDAGADCVIFSDTAGPWDVVMADGKEASKK